MKVCFRSGFFLAITLSLGVLTASMFFIDRMKSDSFTVVGNLSEAQLFNVKNALNRLADPLPENIREAVVELDWVYRVNVRRGWPRGAFVEVVPQRVVAYWNENGFINPDGKILITELLVGGDLPGLYGPEGTEHEVMSRFQELGSILSSHGFKIRNLRRSALGSWTIETNNRVVIILGKEDLKPRIERFLAVNALLRNSGADKRVNRMDARYVNGVAVQFGEELKVSSALGEAPNDINERIGVQSL